MTAFQIEGRRLHRSLETNDRKTAERRAIEKFIRPAKAGRWADIAAMKSGPPARIGEVCDRYEAAAELPTKEHTRRGNSLALRRVVAVAEQIEGNQVAARPVSALSRALVTRFQAEWLGGARNELERDRRAVSANSYLAQARAVFAKSGVLGGVYAGLVIGDLSGFMTAPKLRVLKRGDYVVPGAALQRLLAAAAELRRQRPAVWLVFWLGLQTGLRKGELSAMRWRWFKTDHIRVCFEPDFVPKSRKERATPVIAGLRGEIAAAARACGWPVEPEARVLGAPAEPLFRELSAWMVLHGWDRRQKAHELRKIFASALTAGSSVYAAQAALGHADIQTTSLYSARPAVAAVDVAATFARGA